MTDPTSTETNTGDIDAYAHAEGMNVYVRHDEYGAMLVCAEIFTYAADGWCESSHVVTEITYLPSRNEPMAVMLVNDAANTAGPRASWRGCGENI